MTRYNFQFKLKLMVIKLSVVALVLAPNIALSDQLFFASWSKHFNSRSDLDGFHRMVGIEKDNIFAAYFVNSYKEDTFAISHIFRYETADFSLGLAAGAIYGYRGCKKNIGNKSKHRRLCPALAPILTINKDFLGFRPNIMIVGEAAVLTLSFDTQKLKSYF